MFSHVYFSRLLSSFLLLFLLSGCSITPSQPEQHEAEEETVAEIADAIEALLGEEIEETSDPTAPLAQLESDPELDFVSLPDGFVITTFADVDNARSMATREDADRMIVFVGNRGGDSVYAAIDDDKDYRADRVIEIARKLTMPNGIALADGDLYVAEIERVHIFRDIVAQVDAGEFRSEVWLDGFPDDTHHGRKYISFGPDGHLYMSVGVPCNICEVDPPYGTILRIDKETKEQTVVARGLRNSVGFDWDSDGSLRFTDNGRDLMGDDTPPDELNVLSSYLSGRQAEGEFFGYPYCHGSDVVDTKFSKRGCVDFTPPVVELGPHVAALGMLVYEGNMFPEEYRGKIFIAEHGSWNRTTPIGYRVTLVDPAGSDFEVFADGWLKSALQKLGRPVDVKILEDGSILVSDDAANKVYRIHFNE